MIRTVKLTCWCLFGVLILSSCAQIDGMTKSDDDKKTSSSSKVTTQKEVKKADTTKAAAKSEPAIPSSSPLSKIRKGMKSTRVEEILGKPDSKTRYKTGKRWIPFAGRWLSDARRQTWFYEKKGHLILSQNKYSGQYSVLEIKYNPDQTLP